MDGWIEPLQSDLYWLVVSLCDVTKVSAWVLTPLMCLHIPQFTSCLTFCFEIFFFFKKSKSMKILSSDSGFVSESVLFFVAPLKVTNTLSSATTDTFSLLSVEVSNPSFIYPETKLERCCWSGKAWPYDVCSAHCAHCVPTIYPRTGGPLLPLTGELSVVALWAFSRCLWRTKTTSAQVCLLGY